MLQDRDAAVDHTAVSLRIEACAPEMWRRIWPYLRASNSLSRVDETYIQAVGRPTSPSLSDVTRRSGGEFRVMLRHAHADGPRMITVDNALPCRAPWPRWREVANRSSSHDFGRRDTQITSRSRTIGA